MSNQAEKYTGTKNCKGFNPNSNLIDIQGLDGNEQKYLEVKYRVEWFNRYCEENGISGFIDESEIAYNEQCRMFIAICKVYMDDKLIATGIGGKVLDGDIIEKNRVIQSVATVAKGRALANAGFGTAMCSAGEDGEDPNTLPCDAGITPNNPLRPQQSNTDKKEKPEQTASKSKKSAETPEPLPLTAEDAKGVKVPEGFRSYSGKSLGEVMAMDPNYIKFLATKYAYPDKHPALIAGAKILNDAA